MKISIGADHRGFAMKQALIQAFPALDWIDVGASTNERCDYPLFARAVCEKIRRGDCQRGILICGSGGGMVIAANRHRGIYATLCWHQESARRARYDDGSNLLVIPADFVTVQEARAMVEVWLITPFKGGIYQTRLTMIDAV